MIVLTYLSVKQLNLMGLKTWNWYFTNKFYIAFGIVYIKNETTKIMAFSNYNNVATKHTSCLWNNDIKK